MSNREKITGVIAFLTFLISLYFLINEPDHLLAGLIFTSNLFLNFILAYSYIKNKHEKYKEHLKNKETLKELSRKNTYLEYAAKIIRHDMHSGINTYIPRGIRSIERRLKPSTIKELKLEIPIKLLKGGLKHTQTIYKGVYEFTNLVKADSFMDKKQYDLSHILKEYLSDTSYADSVSIGKLPQIQVNESLICTAIDNLIRNGLKYNDSPTKIVKIYMLDSNTLAVQDNGRGMSNTHFKMFSLPYVRCSENEEFGTGLGLSICRIIIEEHGFKIGSEIPPEGGTIVKIKIK